MQEKRLAAIAVASLLIAFGPAEAMAAPAKSKAKSTVPAAPAYATVNGVKIPRSLADTFLKEQLAQGIPDTPELHKMVREELIRREIVAQEARAKGLHKTTEIASRLALVTQDLLIRAYVKNYLDNNPTSEEAIRAEYEKARGAMTATEFKARHILVETEDEAKAIIAKLDAGEKIETLAAQSKDTGTKDAGGDLGWNVGTAYVAPFAEAVGALEKGKYTAAPVKTEFGFHVILLEDTRTSEPPEFDRVKGQLAQHMQQQKVERLISSLQEKAKIE